MLAAVLLLGCLAQDARLPPKLQEYLAHRAEEAARAKARQAELDAELQRPGLPAWAGTYTRSHGLGGASLTLAPRTGFLETTWSDLVMPDHLPDTWTFGRVRDVGSHVELLVPFTPPAGMSPQVAELTRQQLHDAQDRELVLVTWGPRRYLVDEDALQQFCRATHENRRSAPYFGSFLRRGDEKQPVSGRPRTPEGALRCLDQEPIQARIIAVKPARRSANEGQMTARVVLDVGARDGVRRKMWFLRSGTSGLFRVVAVSQRTSVAEVEFQPPYGQSPRVGWSLSTDSPKPR